MITNCRVVLIRPEVAGNIGAVARVMRNFGLSDLALVAPVADPHSHEARQRSTHGESILLSARRVNTLNGAVADCLAVAGTTARNLGLVRESMIAAPGIAVANLLRHMDQGKVAIVFGPEPSGLTNDEVHRCDLLISIPAADDYPALNLSHAVAICLYELFQQSMQPSPTRSESIHPTHAERDRMFEHLREALVDIHFLYNEKADLLMHALRQLINRAEPDSHEVKLLHGIAGQMQYIARKTKDPET